MLHTISAPRTPPPHIPSPLLLLLLHDLRAHSDLKSACDTIEAYQAELDGDLSALAENLDLELEALQLQVGAAS